MQRRDRSIVCRRRVTAALSAALALGVAGVGAQGRGAATSPPAPGPPDWTHFAADLHIRHERVGPDGTPSGVRAPGLVMRFERRLVGGSWQTTFNLKELEPTLVHGPSGPRPVENPFAIARIEYEHDGAAPRLYDRRGRQVRLPTRADIRALGLPASVARPDWTPEELAGRAVFAPGAARNRGPAAGVLARAADAAARRAELVRALGLPVGTVRGLDRFLVQDDEGVQEVLVQPETTLPVEINRIRGGALVSHARFDYEPFAGSTILRRRYHHEQVVPDGQGERLVTDIELTNVVVSEGGR